MLKQLLIKLRLSTRFSFKLTFDKITLPLAIYSDSELYLDIEYARKMKLGLQDYALKPIRMAYVGKPEDVLGWKVDTDYSQGGNSVASLEVVDDYFLFKGKLQHLRELDYEGKLFCEILSTHLPRKTIKLYNGVRIVVKTDGNQFSFGIFSYHSMTLIHYTALIQDKGGEWVTLELPFNNFVSDMEKQNTIIKLDYGYMDKIKVDAVTFGLYSHEQKEGSFELKIKSVEAIYKEEFIQLEEKYTVPVMFKSILSNGVDTGSRVLKFEKPKRGDK